MILQKIAYPSGGVFEEDLYIRRDRSRTNCIGELQFLETKNSYDTIRFDTYFNTFSYKKWRKYTGIGKVLLQLELQGKARISLTTLELHGCDVDEYIVCSEIVEGTERTTYTFEYTTSADTDALSFHIQPLCENLQIFNGAYLSGIEMQELPDVNISLAICTYKREEYVRKNMAMLDEKVFSNPYSALHGHLNAYISDNGSTLQKDEFNQEYISVKRNKNSGGSGGFSRAAIEAIRDPNNSATHVIFMDDDISFDIDALERTYCFLRALKPEYKKCMLGGAMFRTDRRFIQHAAGETYTIDGIISHKAGYNMFNIVDVLRNEVDEPINYLAWWYCCIPVEIILNKSYSLPLFFQFDDIEFGLRNQDVKKITLNGICCWHLPFDKKWSSFKDYYSIRNRAIIDCMYFKKFNKTFLKKNLFKGCVRKVFQYSYCEANLALLAVEDFLKGPSWLIEQDPVELNNKVIALGDKLLDIDTLPFSFNPHTVKLNRLVNERERHLLKRLITLNGWLLPANNCVAVEIVDPRLQYMYRAKSVVKYDINSGKVLLAQKSWKEAVKIAIHFVKVCHLINHKLRRVTVEYRKEHDAIVTEEFWRNFLDF